MAGYGHYEFPQTGPGLSRASGQRGIASLTHPRVGTLRLRANPKEFNWSYTLNKRIDQTYGGRVIQLLGTRIDDFTFKADAGLGRWAEINRIAKFMRDVMIAQRGGIPATFEYTTRGWRFNAYVVSMPFADAVEEVLREFDVTLKVQEDVTGLMSRSTLTAELRRLQEDMAFRRSQYNDPLLGGNTEQIPDAENDPSGILSTVGNLLDLGNSLGLTSSLNFLTQNIPTAAQGKNVINNIVAGGRPQ